MQETQVQFLARDDPLQEGAATGANAHSLTFMATLGIVMVPVGVSFTR